MGGIPPRRHCWDARPPSWISERAGAGSIGARNHAVPDQPVYDLRKQGAAQGGMGHQIPLCGTSGARLRGPRVCFGRGWPIDDRKIMTEVYAFIYQTGILTEDCEKWDVRPNLDKPWAKFQMHFTDAQRKIRRSQK